MDMLSRAGPRAVALESTLLVHGVPVGAALSLHDDLSSAVRAGGAEPALVGVLGGRAIVGMSGEELTRLLSSGGAAKLNTSNLGLALHRGEDGATTVSATMELAARAGVRVFATGGIGGVHRGYGTRLDVSADLLALARFPVLVVASGVKGILDVAATREALESLGVPVIGFGTSSFPAFYVRESGCGVDARFDDAEEVAAFAACELARTGRGVLVCNPAPADAAMTAPAFAALLEAAEREVSIDGEGTGRGATPGVLSAMHRLSGGATLSCNRALAVSNAALAGRVAAAIGRGR